MKLCEVGSAMWVEGAMRRSVARRRDDRHGCRPRRSSFRAPMVTGRTHNSGLVGHAQAPVIEEATIARTVAADGRGPRSDQIAGGILILLPMAGSRARLVRHKGGPRVFFVLEPDHPGRIPESTVMAYSVARTSAERRTPCASAIGGSQWPLATW